jgi:cobalt-zinc-cadmium efflux system membrane fusion protein
MSIISPNNPTTPGGGAKASAEFSPGSSSQAAGKTTVSDNRLERVRNGARMATVVAALAVIALVGHATDWTLPKFSSLAGGAAGAGDWCDQHNVPDSACIECKPALWPADKDYGWCAQHGVAQCPLEHAEVAQVKTSFTVSPERIEQADRALALMPRAENNSRCKLHERRVQFASAEALVKSGVDIAVVEEQPLVEAIAANGEVVYDQTGLAHLASRAAGTIYRVEKQIGDRVEKDEILAIVDAADVGRIKSEFLQALVQLRLKQKTLARLKPLAASGAIAGGQFQVTEAELQETNIRLLAAQQSLTNFGLPLVIDDYDTLDAEQMVQEFRRLGIPNDLAESLGPQANNSNLLPLRSSLAGVVIERDAVPGEVVDTSTNLFTIANLSRMHLLLDVRQDDARHLALGQTVLFRSGDNPSEPQVKGSVAWISPAVDDRTRTVKIRADLPNADGRLKANTFGAGLVVLREEPSALFVPNEAIHWDGCCQVVFVRDKHFFQSDAPKFFHVRKVRTGVKTASQTEIIAGLLPGEVIAAKNSTVIAAQLLKSNLGAGCGCAPPPSTPSPATKKSTIMDSAEL